MLQSNAAEAASGKTLEALAQVIRALAPEVCGISFHDFAADTLWLSEDFLLPEDHQLVEDTLSGDSLGNLDAAIGAREDGRYAMAIPVIDALGAINGAVRLSIDAQVSTARTTEPLQQRLAPVLTCLAAEFDRRQLAPPQARDREYSAQLEAAIEAERFELFLQPICSLRHVASLARYEVLVRLRLQDASLLEPAAFFGTAVQQRSMTSIDRWVIRTLFKWLSDHRKVWAREPAMFCVNLSAQSMTDSHFIDYVEACVRKSSVPPQALCFEVTERFAASANGSVAESMQRLEALGCEVALDDFGGHAASYGYLRTVPAHYFKIDGALVIAAADDRVARATVSGIVRMAADLGVHTVAEAVELETQLEAMKLLGVDYAQGYLLGRPESLNDYDFATAACH